MQRIFAIAPFTLLVLATLTVAVPGTWVVSGWATAAYVLVGIWVIRGIWAGWDMATRQVACMAAFPEAVAWVQTWSGITVNQHQTELAALSWGGMAALVLVTGSTFRQPEQRERFLRWTACFAGSVAVLVLIQPFLVRLAPSSWGLPSMEDMAGPFQNRNTYASFIELTLPLVVWRARESGWTWWLLAAIMVASVIVTGSRAGAALVAIEFLLLLAVLWPRAGGRVRWGVAAAGSLVCVVMMSAIAGWETWWHRIQLGDPLVYRREILQSAAEMIRERPWTGFGLGTFQDAYPRFASFDVGRVVNHAHSDWIQWVAEGGVALMIWTMLVWWWVSGRAFRRLWSLGLPFVFLHACIDYPLQRVGLAAWVWVLAGAVEAAGREPKPALRPEPVVAPVAAPTWRWKPVGSSDRFSAKGGR